MPNEKSGYQPNQDVKKGEIALSDKMSEVQIPEEIRLEKTFDEEEYQEFQRLTGEEKIKRAKEFWAQKKDEEPSTEGYPDNLFDDPDMCWALIHSGLNPKETKWYSDYLKAFDGDNYLLNHADWSGGNDNHYKMTSEGKLAKEIDWSWRPRMTSWVKEQNEMLRQALSLYIKTPTPKSQHVHIPWSREFRIQSYENVFPGLEEMKDETGLIPNGALYEFIKIDPSVEDEVGDYLEYALETYGIFGVFQSPSKIKGDSRFSDQKIDKGREILDYAQRQHGSIISDLSELKKAYSEDELKETVYH